MARTVDVKLKVPDINRKTFKIVFLAHFALTAFAMMSWGPGVNLFCFFHHHNENISGIYFHQSPVSWLLYLEPQPTNKCWACINGLGYQLVLYHLWYCHHLHLFPQILQRSWENSVQCSDGHHQPPAQVLLQLHPLQWLAWQGRHQTRSGSSPTTTRSDSYCYRLK